MASLFKIVCGSEGEPPSYTLRDWGDRKDKAKALRAGIYVNSITLKTSGQNCRGREGERPSYTLRDWGDRKDKAKKHFAGIYVNSITLKPEIEKCGGRALSRVAKIKNGNHFASATEATTQPNRSQLSERSENDRPTPYVTGAIVKIKRKALRAGIYVNSITLRPEGEKCGARAVFESSKRSKIESTLRLPLEATTQPNRSLSFPREGYSSSYTLRDWGDRKDKAKALRAGIYVNSITLKLEAKKCGGRALFESSKRSKLKPLCKCHWRRQLNPIAFSAFRPVRKEIVFEKFDPSKIENWNVFTYFF
ncbi:hypothetical protein CEXT_759501 [Caerostris extrusa]|uniref:Uncharacterized protein n=1 Tax=Caerostris extrusa TaxID=172846 RepID=A0AAV4MBT1_CAEEX|nr:hypothetical protein CEXT_759501 [Caerostris extrusa]